MFRKRQIILSATALCLLLAVVWGFYQYSRPHASAQDKQTAFIITADSLYGAFSTNEPVANKTFMNKVLEVKGTVQDLTTSDRKPVLLLQTQGIGFVNCLMAVDSTTIFSTIKKNSAITIKGKCSGFLMDVNLVDCVIK